MEIKGLSQVFKDYYIIPSYQRGYAWGKKQLEDFWSDLDLEDINDNQNDNQQHFFGTFLLEKNREGKVKNQYFVVDGQQRLTTLAILLSLLSSKLDKKTDKKLFYKYIYDKTTHLYHLDYEKSNDNKNYLIYKIYKGDDRERAKNNYQKNLKFAKDFFKKKIEKIDAQSILEKINKILIFDLQEISSLGNGINSQIIFETLNNRGKALTVLEKLKNRLMFLASKLSSESEETISNINKVWTELYNELGKLKNEYDTLLEDDMLSAHLTIYRRSENTTFSVTGAEIKLFQMFCMHPEQFPLIEQSDLENWNEKSEADKDEDGREKELSSDKIEKYIDSLLRFCKAWCYISNYSVLEDCPLKNGLILDPTKETKILLTTIYMNKKLSAGEKEDLFKIIEAVIFRRQLPGEWGRTYNFATLAYYFYNQEEAYEEDDDKRLKYMTLDNLKEELQYAVDQEFDVAYIVNNFRQFYKIVHATKKGFYRWQSIQFFLYRYELELSKNNEIWYKKFSKNFQDFSIEHIMPQNLKYWPEINNRFTRDKQNIIINSLGNLMLVSKSKNAEMQDKDWKNKKKYYKENPTNCEKEIVKNGTWNPAKIKERGEKMLKFFEKMLNEYEFGGEPIFLTEKQKVHLLCGDCKKLGIFGGK